MFNMHVEFKYFKQKYLNNYKYLKHISNHKLKYLNIF